MVINETNKQMIRDIIVELFKEVASKQTFGVSDDVLQLDEHLHDWVGAKIDKYKINVYGATLEEKY
tara:strand:- start:4649 stop:4846 length:198 start_codon:yes stop_codon:yes gene_type:complete